ncbi:MAG: hypothetical protein JXA06_00740 [Bacteroidetes bacterium]|nr:hypothetical protein [Bacteroidota bacterium]
MIVDHGRQKADVNDIGYRVDHGLRESDVNGDGYREFVNLQFSIFNLPFEICHSQDAGLGCRATSAADVQKGLITLSSFWAIPVSVNHLYPDTNSEGEINHFTPEEEELYICKV